MYENGIMIFRSNILCANGSTNVINHFAKESSGFDGTPGMGI